MAAILCCSGVMAGYALRLTIVECVNHFSDGSDQEVEYRKFIMMVLPRRKKQLSIN
jgi:hypothetical protein